MSMRLRCRECKTAFVIAPDQAGRRVTCPKCGAEQIVPSTALRVPKDAATASSAAPAASVFVVADAPRSPGRLRKLAFGFLIVVAVAGAAVGVAWPTLYRWWHPIPPDPVAVAARNYLQALAEGDYEAARRLGTLEEPPAIRSFGVVQRLEQANQVIRGSFAPLAALHAQINEKYEYLPASGRFKVRDELGAAAETLDVLHDAKTKAEHEAIAKKIASGNPDDLFDAAEGLGGAFAKLAEGVLAPKKLIPTYRQLVLDARPPLAPDPAMLALDYATHRESWDALLKRPFPTLRADGPFIFERTEVVASVRDRLASLGDPPTELRLTLVRFRLEGIDTGWKVVAARRPRAMPEPAPEPEPAPPPPAASERRSPGEVHP